MEQNCKRCGTSWTTDEPIQCPTCQDDEIFSAIKESSPTMADPKIVELGGTLYRVNPKNYRFAPENYKVTWKDRLSDWFWRWWPLV